jgi:hypothetical protein
MAKLIKWRVQSEPTGQYRSFQQRGWPQAEYQDGTIAAAVYCTDKQHDYNARKAAAGDHAPLIVMVADHSATPWRWRKLKGEFTTLAQAKAALEKLLELYPRLIPRAIAQAVRDAAYPVPEAK